MKSLKGTCTAENLLKAFAGEQFRLRHSTQRKEAVANHGDLHQPDQLPLQ